MKIREKDTYVRSVSKLRGLGGAVWVSLDSYKPQSRIEIALVHHRLPQPIRVHSMICFLALILQRVMRARLKQNSITGVSHLDDKQLAILNVLQATKPTITHQYANL